MAKPKLLILRGGAIGDFVLTLPAIKALRKQWPDAYIEIIGYPHIANLAHAGGLVNKISSLDKADAARYFSLSPSLSEKEIEYIRSFDLIISYLYDPTSIVTTNLYKAGAKQVIYGSPIVESMHAVDHLIKPLETLAIYPEETEYPEIKLSKEAAASGKKRVKDIGKDIVAIHPGSGSPAKNWPLDKFLELAEQIKKQMSLSPMFIIGEADRDIADKINEKKCAIPLLTDCSLVELAEALSACRAYVGNDSGVTHVATALGVPVIVLFGPSNHEIFGPRNSRSMVVKSDEPTTDGLSAISTNKVFETLELLLETTA